MRSVYEVSKDIAGYAPTGGDTWQNVGMRQVPVRLLTELREAVEREQRVKVAWQAEEADLDALETLAHDAIKQSREGRTVDYPNAVAAVEAMVPTFAGAWKFDG